jgi:hypothetical protein
MGKEFDMSTRYRVHCFDLRMTADQRVERILNGLEGEVVAMVPNVTSFPGGAHVDFLLIVEKIA